MVFGTPLALIASWVAVRSATDRPFGVAALVISIVEAVALVGSLWFML